MTKTFEDLHAHCITSGKNPDGAYFFIVGRIARTPRNADKFLFSMALLFSPISAAYIDLLIIRYSDDY